MPKLNVAAMPESNRTGYPAPFDAPVKGRWWRRLAPAGALSELTASYVRLEPGAWSSQRHWHVGEDELVVMIAGEAVLIDDDGEHAMRAGDVAAFPKNDGNGHHLINRSDQDCLFVAIGAGELSGGEYADIDMKWSGERYLRKDGTPY
jgi:uncharacterized cupin superfamily protein